MSTMTDKPKRPRDANQLAKFIVDAATGEVDEGRALSVASKGGKARAEALSSSRRKEIAKKAAKSRWAKRPAPSEGG